MYYIIVEIVVNAKSPIPLSQLNILLHTDDGLTGNSA